MFARKQKKLMKDFELVKLIYHKTDGCCHVCHRRLSLKNYGVHGRKGAWHIEHSKAKANGGTDHMNNLYPACTSCNLEKGTNHSQTARRRNGVSRAPYSNEKKQSIKDENTLVGMISGGLVGSVFGPAGIVVCSLIGGLIGEGSAPDR